MKYLPFQKLSSRPEMIALLPTHSKFVLRIAVAAINAERVLWSPHVEKPLEESTAEIRVEGFDIRQKLLR